MRAAAPVADLASVLLFVVIGRASHGEDVGVAGVVGTAWPFVVGLAVGWVVLLAARMRADRPWPAGVLVTVLTVAVGMALRPVAGEGVEVSFVVVATCFLALFLVGWRGLSAGLRRRRGRRHAPDDASTAPRA